LHRNGSNLRDLLLDFQLAGVSKKSKKTGISVQKKGIWQNYNNILEFNAKFGNFYQKAF